MPLALQNPYPIIKSVYSADPIEAILSTFDKYNFRDHIFYASTL